MAQDPTADLHWDNYRGAIHDIFSQNAHKFPERPCVIETNSKAPERTFTYGQINASSNQLAHYFLAHGCEVGDVVMIYAYRGVDLVVAYMGALKAGATVSVLDPQYPPDRQRVLLDVAKPKFLVYIRKANQEFGKPPQAVTDFASNGLEIKASVPALELSQNGELAGGTVDGVDCLAAHRHESQISPTVVVGPDSAPTLSFTSGSEGKPKGVLGRHFSLTYYTPWMATRFGLSESDRFTMLSGIAHDPIQRDIFTPLYLGAQIIIPPADVIAYELLAEWMRQQCVTVTHLTPAMGQILVGGAVSQFPALRYAFFVGDLLTRKDCKRLRDLAPNASVINLFGTTETQRAVSFFEVPSKAKAETFLDSLPHIIPVGQGMMDVQLLVVDPDNKDRLCEVEEQGELYIRAGGLAEGYLGDDETTAALNKSKFVSNWFVAPEKWTAQASHQPRSEPWRVHYKGPRDRLYKTGDLGRLRTDGSVECTGRIDSQVKIRGFRIELGEIDAHMSQHSFVRENVTVLRRDRNEEQTLVTYYVPETKRWLQHVQLQELRIDGSLGAQSMSEMLRQFKSLSENCREFLAGRLPKYAVPNIFIPLARMPLNPNGKIDKPSLPFPDATDLAALTKRRASSVAAKMTDTQLKLASIWASVLPNRTARMFVPESNFFDEGGHSILAQQLFFQMKKTWQDVDVPVSIIFQSQTLEALAAEIDRALDPIGMRLDAIPLATDGDVQDEAYATDGRELAQKLPHSFQGPDENLGLTNPTVFLTGATGFLGAYILRELLTGPTTAKVIALVRAKSSADGLARLQSICNTYGFWDDSWTSRLEVVIGDLSKPRLGLVDTLWLDVSKKADVIIHNGAVVNWMLPYSSLRAANVLSTMDCIRLCAREKPKRLLFVSSTSTLDSKHYFELATPVLETDPLEGSSKGLSTGYGQSKWSSEFLVREAGRRGLVGAIVRPGYVTGDPASGISITDDFLIRLLKGCLQVGARPDIKNTVNVVPTTIVSRIIVAAAFHFQEATGHNTGVVQITGHPRITLNEWTGALEEYGYHAPISSYGAWCDKVREYVNDQSRQAEEEFALLPLFHFVVGDLPANTIAPELDDANAAAVLKAYGPGVTSNGTNPLAANAVAVNVDAIGMYLSYLVAIGFLSAPTGKGGKELPKLDSKQLQSRTNEQLGGRSARP